MLKKFQWLPIPEFSLYLFRFYIFHIYEGPDSKYFGPSQLKFYNFLDKDQAHSLC